MAQPWRVATTMLVQFCTHDTTLNPVLIVCYQTKYGIHGNECRDWALVGALGVLVGRCRLVGGLMWAYWGCRRLLRWRWHCRCGAVKRAETFAQGIARQLRDAVDTELLQDMLAVRRHCFSTDR